MSSVKKMEVVCDLLEGKQLDETLEDKGIDYDGKIFVLRLLHDMRGEDV